MCVQLTSWDWLLEHLPVLNYFSITYCRTCLESGVLTAPQAFCEYQVPISHGFKVVVTGHTHKEAAFPMPVSASQSKRSPREMHLPGTRVRVGCTRAGVSLLLPPYLHPQTNPCSNWDAWGVLVLRWEDPEQGSCWWETNHWENSRPAYSGNLFQLGEHTVLWAHSARLS